MIRGGTFWGTIPDLKEGFTNPTAVITLHPQGPTGVEGNKEAICRRQAYPRHPAVEPRRDRRRQCRLPPDGRISVTLRVGRRPLAHCESRQMQNGLGPTGCSSRRCGEQSTYMIGPDQKNLKGIVPSEVHIHRRWIVARISERGQRDRWRWEVVSLRSATRG